MGHPVNKCSGSPQRQQAGPDLPAALVAGSGSSEWRGESGETETAGPSRGQPAPLGGLSHTCGVILSGLSWGGTRGGPGGRDLGKGTG